MIDQGRSSLKVVQVTSSTAHALKYYALGGGSGYFLPMSLGRLGTNVII